MRRYSNALLAALFQASFALLFFTLLSPGTAWSVTASPAPREMSQPDGSRIRLRLRGDEFYSWHEDDKGYTVIRDTATGNWVYAEPGGTGIKPGRYKVGAANPAAAGLNKGMRDEKLAALAGARRNSRRYSHAARVSAAPAAAVMQTPPTTGTMKNLVVLVYFKDDVQPVRSWQDFENLFNQTGYSYDGAVGSVKDYYTQVSGGLLTIQSSVTAWVELPYAHNYYAANVKQLALDAINAANVKANIDFSAFDSNNDDWVDGLTIIHAGFGQESTGNTTDIWSQQWELDTLVQIDGKKMQMFHTESELRDASGTGITRIGTICHETGHFLGLPDLYDTTGASHGAGNFCLMAEGSWNGNGASHDGRSPAHMSAWCKKTAGWATATQISAQELYSISRAEDSLNAFYILRGGAFPVSEYFLVENRQGYGFDASLPGASRGILIWHIDESMPGNDNKNHYLVDLEEAGGTQHLAATAADPFTGGDDADYFRAGNNDSFGDLTSPNSRSYGGLTLARRMYGISATGVGMSFGLEIVDESSPTAVTTINDGLGGDISTAGSLTELSANWTMASDPESGIFRYWFAVGTLPGLADVVVWTNNGTALSTTTSGLQLTNGATYYFSVKAENGKGMLSDAASSNGQVVNVSLPSDITYVKDGLALDMDYVASLGVLSANWGPSSHSSGIHHYEYAIGTAPGGTTVTGGWVNNALSRTVTVTGLSLAENTTYYFAARAFSNAGTYSSAAASDGQLTDTISPTAQVQVVSSLPARPGVFSAKLVITETNALASAPTLKIAPGCGAASYDTSLSWLVQSTWTVSSFIETYFAGGGACFNLSATDLAGNTGTQITSGGSFTIDASMSGAAGGTLANSDKFGVTVPAGVIAGTFFISVSSVSTALTDAADAASPASLKMRSNDLVREFLIKDAGGTAIHSFSAPLTITLAYPDANNDGRIDGDNMRETLADIYYLDEALGAWTLVEGTTRDTAANTITAEVDHFSLYSLRALDISLFTLENLKGYPNPCDFRKSPVFHIDGIPTDETAPEIYIYNSAGEQVRVLRRGEGIDQYNAASWDGRVKGGSRAASGLYIYLVKTRKYGRGSGKLFALW